MKMKLAVIFVCLFISVFAWAGDKKASNASTSPSADKIQANIDDVKMLKNKVSDLELTSDLRYKHYDEILEAQRWGYLVNISVLLGLLAAFIALIVFLNFNFIKGELSRNADNAISENRRELATTTQELRKNFNDATQDLRLEFNKQVRDSLNTLSSGTEKNLKELETKFEKKIKHLEAHHDNALGRIYEQTGSFDSAAIWYARGLEIFLETSSSDKWLRLQIKNIQDNVQKCKFDEFTSEQFSEIEEVVDKIPEKFKDEKDKLKQILVEMKKETGTY